MQADQGTQARLEWLAGYRVLRRLGSGSRASVYFGYPADARDVPAQHDPGPHLGVALKVFEPTVSAESVDVEIDALSAVSSPHVVRLLDVAIAPDRPRCLVLQRLPGGSLAALLARRGALSAGAAVTVLVSVARALEALRAAGYDHDRPSPANILFDETGRPVLAGLGHAVTAAGAGPRGLALLVRTLFERMEHDGLTARAHSVAAWLEEHGSRAPDSAVVEDRLFGLAEPAPVLPFAATAQEERANEGDRSPVGIRAALRPGPAAAAGSGARPRGRPAAHVAVAQRVRWGRAAELAQTLRHGLRSRKRPLVVAGAVGAVALVLALALLPVSHGQADGLSLTSSGEPRTSTSAPAGRHTALPAPRATAPPATAPPATAPSAIAADEPVAATDALLSLRRACLRSRSLPCLAGVDQQGSPMLEADRSLVRARVDAGPGQTYVGYRSSLIQRSGGSALIALTPAIGAPASGAGDSAETPKPATALVIEGETGWRLREVFAD